MKLNSSAWNSIAALAATVTAIAAVAVAVSDHSQQREYNRLSVMPYVSLSIKLERDSTRTRAAVVMANDGVGPAIIQDAWMRLPGAKHPVRHWDEAANTIRKMGFAVTGYTDFLGGEAAGV